MKKILLATDGSAYAENAAWLLAHLAHQEPFELLVLTVIEGPSIHRSFPDVPWTDDDIERERAQAEKNFQVVRGMFDGANINLRKLELDGHTSKTIVQAATDEKIDLVVLGAKGHSVVARMILGSISDYVATHSPCSVWVARPTEMREAIRPIRIAIAYENTVPAQDAIDEIELFTWGPGAEIQVVAVDNLPGIFSPLVRGSLATGAEKAAEQLRKAGIDAKVHLLENAHAGDALVQYTEDQKFDVLVMGESPRTRIDRIILGSVSRFVLRHASCSVWIARQKPTEKNA